MIEYRIKDPSFFIRCIKSIATVIDETVLQFGGRLRTYGMDGSRICLYELNIGESELDIIRDGKIDIMINIFDLQKIIRRFSNPDELIIQYDNNQIIIKGKIGNISKTFRMSVLAEDVPIDPMEALGKMELNAIFKTDLDDFIDMIRDAEVYSDNFTLMADEEGIKMKAFGNIGDVETEMTIEDFITSDEVCQYSLVFAKNILKTLGSQEVTISFGTDMPIMIYDKLSKDSFIRWYLAPKVTNPYKDEIDDV